MTGKYCNNARCSVSGNGACPAWEQCAFFKWDVERKALTDKGTCPKEEEEQKALFKWCCENGVQLVHIPNERKCNAATGARLALQGVRKGFPDNFIVGARKGFNGLFIELKRNSKTLSKVSREQKQWLRYLNNNGYKAIVCYGAEEAIREIKNYLEE